MQQAHVESLQAKHAGIESRLREELSRPVPDTVAVHQLKREKLVIKDVIAGQAH